MQMAPLMSLFVLFVPFIHLGLLLFSMASFLPLMAIGTNSTRAVGDSGAVHVLLGGIQRLCRWRTSTSRLPMRLLLCGWPCRLSATSESVVAFVLIGDVLKVAASDATWMMPFRRCDEGHELGQG